MLTEETLFSYVNQSDCTERGVLSEHGCVQRLDEADRQFRLICALSESLVGARRVRHIRFHAPAPCGTLLVVSSLVCFDGPHILTIVHQMKNVVTGAVLATAIDGYTPPAGAARTFRSKFKDVVQAMPEEAAPRALPLLHWSTRRRWKALLKAADRSFTGVLYSQGILGQTTRQMTALLRSASGKHCRMSGSRRP
ncbi:hypothetical protein [Pannonibacter phragmitetus]|uniref:hypothetical protein n=1 Tax=Pannonibacter phragmitetus TaxID=121719 RepID=UPI003D2EF075